MRIFALIAAFALVSATSAQAGDARSLSLAGVDGKIPTALGKAAETPKVVEAPRPPDPPRPPDVPKAAETPPAPPAAAPAPAAETAPAYTPRPAIVGTKPSDKAGQVTFDDKSAAPTEPAATSTDKPKQAKVEKPRRKRGGGYWNEARIMREVYRYSGYAWMAGGW
jgi:outer membrane biosynthesis protein TonB